jgi:hypothetical protein
MIVDVPSHKFRICHLIHNQLILLIPSLQIVSRVVKNKNNSNRRGGESGKGGSGGRGGGRQEGNNNNVDVSSSHNTRSRTQELQ